MKQKDPVMWGVIGGLGILIFYLTIVSIFESVGFAFMSLRSLWYWIFPLALGFGIQMGLFISIANSAAVGGVVAGTGGVAGGSMVACCSHFLLNLVPFLGLSGFAVVLMQYQEWFFGLGIISNIVGITFMLNHKKKMEKEGLKGGCHLDG